MHEKLLNLACQGKETRRGTLKVIQILYLIEVSLNELAKVLIRKALVLGCPKAKLQTMLLMLVSTHVIKMY